MASRKPPPTFNPRPPAPVRGPDLRDLEDPTHGFPLRSLSGRRGPSEEELEELGLVDPDDDTQPTRRAVLRPRPSSPLSSPVLVDARWIVLWLLVLSGLVAVGGAALAVAVVYL